MSYVLLDHFADPARPQVLASRHPGAYGGAVFRPVPGRSLAELAADSSPMRDQQLGWNREMVNSIQTALVLLWVDFDPNKVRLWDEFDPVTPTRFFFGSTSIQ